MASAPHWWDMSASSLRQHLSPLTFEYDWLFFRGLSPEEADLQYLKIAATKLVMFGVDAHPAKVREGLCFCVYKALCEKKL